MTKFNSWCVWSVAQSVRLDRCHRLHFSMEFFKCLTQWAVFFLATRAQLVCDTDVEMILVVYCIWWPTYPISLLHFWERCLVHMYLCVTKQVQIHFNNNKYTIMYTSKIRYKLHITNSLIKISIVLMFEKLFQKH